MDATYRKGTTEMEGMIGGGGGRGNGENARLGT